MATMPAKWVFREAGSFAAMSLDTARARLPAPRAVAWVRPAAVVRRQRLDPADLPRRDPVRRDHRAANGRHGSTKAACDWRWRKSVRAGSCRPSQRC